MLLVQQMNNIANRVKEIVYKDLIYQAKIKTTRQTGG